MGTANETERVNWPGALTWAGFLASSWTWVIGMWLPIYLLVDYGLISWPVFALFNVAGAMSVGFVWRRAGSSESFVARNETAMRWFSIATILFHVWFMTWFLAWSSNQIADDYAYGAAAAGLVLVIAMLRAGRTSKHFRIRGLVIWILSLLLVVAMFLTSWGSGMNDPRLVVGTARTVDLALTAPLIAFGFLLCPHMDLTLHRARQEAPGATGTAAFVIGFGLLFPVLIGATLFYGAGLLVGSGFSYYLPAYVALQAIFTLSAHMRELLDRGVLWKYDPELTDADRRRRRAARTAGCTTLALVFMILLGIADAEAWLPALREAYSTIDAAGEAVQRTLRGDRRMVYDSFISLYGLVFPAWLLIVAIMGRGARRVFRAAAYFVALAGAGWLLFLGMFEDRYLMNAIAMALVLAIGVAMRFAPRSEPAAGDALA